MTQDEAIDVLETIAEVYPKYELTKKKAKILLPALMKMDYTRVLNRLSLFATEHPFPPTIAEIAAYAPEENKHLETIRRWQTEAAKVPDEIKQRFKCEMEQLVKEQAEHESNKL